MTRKPSILGTWNSWWPPQRWMQYGLVGAMHRRIHSYRRNWRLVFFGFIGDDILPSYIEIIITHEIRIPINQGCRFVPKKHLRKQHSHRWYRSLDLDIGFHQGLSAWFRAKSTTLDWDFCRALKVGIFFCGAKAVFLDDGYRWLVLSHILK